MLDAAYDQAAGLRQLFARSTARTLVFLPSLGPGTAPLLARWAGLARSRGITAAVTRYAGTSNGEPVLADDRLPYPDLVLVEAGELPPCALLPENHQIVLPVALHPPAITAAYRRLKQWASVVADREVAVLVVRGRDQGLAHAAFHNMQRLARDQLGLGLRWLGWLPAVAVAPYDYAFVEPRLRPRVEDHWSPIIEPLLQPGSIGSAGHVDQPRAPAPPAALFGIPT